MAGHKKRERNPISVKRPRGRRDSLDVFKLLLEDVGPQTPDGWFALPWRTGHRARMLVSKLYAELGRTGLEVPVDETLAYRIAPDWDEAYWLCERLRVDLMRETIPLAAQLLLGMRLRILQLEVSNSHGGGHGYNSVLLAGWHRLDELLPIDLAQHVLYARRSDALGPNPAPRRAAAFDEAWRLGLFRAAYALA